MQKKSTVDKSAAPVAFILIKLLLLASEIPRLANSLAGLGLGEERRIKVFQILSLRQEQPLCSLLQCTVTHSVTSVQSLPEYHSR